MISCKGCPFLTSIKDILVVNKETEEVSYTLNGYVCALGYYIERCKDSYTSKGCKLEAVTYSLKDKKDSIDFIPKEIQL